MFREDLFYRIAEVELKLPPLRERLDDLPLLAKSLLTEMFPTRYFKLTEEAWRKLECFLWPGNIRQLRNVLRRSVAFLESDCIDVDDLYLPHLENAPESVNLTSSIVHSINTMLSSSEEASFSLKTIVEDTERTILTRLLEHNEWNIRKTAQQLKISRIWLYNRIKKHQIQTPDGRL